MTSLCQLGRDSPSCTPRAPAAHTVGKTSRTKRQRHNLHRRLIQKVRTCVYSLVFTPSMRQVFTANESWSLPLAPRAGLHCPQSGRFLPPTGAGLYRSHPGQVFTALNPAGFYRRALRAGLHRPQFQPAAGFHRRAPSSQLPFSLAVRVSVRVYFAHPFHCSRFMQAKWAAAAVEAAAVPPHTEHMMCSVCRSVFQDPRVLNCGHTFCLSCLEHINSAAGTSQCPECRCHFNRRDFKKVYCLSAHVADATNHS